MREITAKELKALMEKWDEETLSQCREGQIIDIDTGEVTPYEWTSITESSRKAKIGFFGATSGQEGLMALGAPQQNLVTQTGQLCAELLRMAGEIEQIDVLFNGAANWDSLITDAELATIPSFAAAGLTATNVADAIFILKTARAAAYANLPAAVILGNLG